MGVYSTNLSMDGAFLFTEESIRAFFEIVTRFAKKNAKCTFEFDGGDDFETSNVEEALSDLLTRTRSIEKIKMSGYREGNMSQYVYLSIRRSGLLTALVCTIQGDRAECSATRSEIESVANAHRLWYSSLLSSDDRYGKFVTLAVSMFAAAAFIVLNSHLGIDISGLVGFATFMAEVIAFILILGQLRRWFFPSIVFSFGFSDRRRRRIEYVQQFMLIVVGASIVVSLSASFVAKKLGW